MSRTAAGIFFLLACLGLALGVMPYLERKFFRMRAAFAFLATEVLLHDAAIPEKGALALVAQNPKAMIGAAVFCTLIFFLVFKVSGHAASGVPAEGAKTVGIFAGVFSSLLIGLPLGALVSWLVRTAYLEPIGLMMLLQRFHEMAKGQSVDPAMRARIENATSNLRATSRLAGVFD